MNGPAPAGLWIKQPLSITSCLRPQTVDAKKLEKAEAKLKAKHERRNEKDSQKSSGQL